MKMKLFNSIPLVALMFLGACNKTDNTLIIRDQQISNLVAKSESECNTIQPKFDAKTKTISYHQFGLSNNYLINTNNAFFQNTGSNTNEDVIARNSILSKINWNELSNAQRNKIELVVESFARQQTGNLQHSQLIIAFVNDSAHTFIKKQNQRLDQNMISKIQYDQIMTDIEDTFLTILRSMYVEQKILISSSTNYRCLLTEIQNTLTEKQWEEFFSCVYNK
jgi:hypothetical protein